jgi:predicted nucleotidyltransferase
LTSKDTRGGHKSIPNALNETSPVEFKSVLKSTCATNVTDEARQLRERKNELKRMREQKKRERVEAIRAKAEGQRTEEKVRLLQRAKSRRGHKNYRARERSTETRHGTHIAKA